METWRQCCADRTIWADRACQWANWSNWKCRHHRTDRRKRNGSNWRRPHRAYGAFWRSDWANGRIGERLAWRGGVFAVMNNPLLFSALVKQKSLPVAVAGKLFAWGYVPYWGQPDSPTQVDNRDWKSVSGGNDHVLVISESGELFAIGDNTYGQIGDGTNAAKSSLTLVGSQYRWKAVSAGFGFSVAITEDGDLYSWGRNHQGQLGNGTTTNSNSPSKVGTSKWQVVSSHFSNTLAIRDDGKVFAWGNNTYGQIGDGTATVRTSPAQVGNSTWASVGCGGLVSFAIRDDGKLFAWGYNGYGAYGTGSFSQSSTPAQISNDTWKSVCSGGYHSLAIRSDSRLFAAGLNVAGQLGNASFLDRQSTRVQIGQDTWSALPEKAAENNSCAIRSDRTVFCWGDNGWGQIGDGTTTDRRTPTQSSQRTALAVASGTAFTVAIFTS